MCTWAMCAAQHSSRGEHRCGELRVCCQCPCCLAVEAWQGSVHRYAPTVQEGGVEKLTVEFR